MAKAEKHTHKHKHIADCRVTVSWPDPQALAAAHLQAGVEDEGVLGGGWLEGAGQRGREEQDGGGDDKHSMYAGCELGSEVFGECPFEVVAPAARCDGRVAGAIQVRLPCANKHVGEHDLPALMQWYTHVLNQGGSPGTGITLQFASSLAKEGRAQVHKEAERAGLVTVSRGFGEDRHVCVGAKASSLSAAAPCSHGALGAAADSTTGVGVMGKEASMLVERICGWCVSEGNSLARLSRSEIHEMVRTNSYHPAVAALKASHDRAGDLCTAIYQNQQSKIEEMLADEPALAATSCSKTGQLPLHAAVAAGRLPMIKLIKSAAAAAAAAAEQERQRLLAEKAQEKEQQASAEAQESQRKDRLEEEWRHALAAAAAAVPAVDPAADDASTQAGAERYLEWCAQAYPATAEEIQGSALQQTQLPAEAAVAQAEEASGAVDGRACLDAPHLHAPPGEGSGSRPVPCARPARACAGHARGLAPEAGAGRDDDGLDDDMDEMMRLLLGDDGAGDNLVAAHADAAPVLPAVPAAPCKDASQWAAKHLNDRLDEGQVAVWAVRMLSDMVGEEVEQDLVSFVVNYAVAADAADVELEVDAFLNAWTERVHEVAMWPVRVNVSCVNVPMPALDAGPPLFSAADPPPSTLLRCACVYALWRLACVLGCVRGAEQADRRQARRQAHPTQPRLARYEAFASTFRSHITSLRAAAAHAEHRDSGGAGESARQGVRHAGCEEEIILFQARQGP